MAECGADRILPEEREGRDTFIKKIISEDEKNWGKVTYCKAGEDVRSCPHTDADHAADAVETPAVRRTRNRPSIHALWSPVDGGAGGDGGHLLKLSQHRW